MKKGRLIWGIILLALGAFLGLLHFILPEDELMFMIGGTNMSYIPPIILGIIGIAFLVMAKR